MVPDPRPEDVLKNTRSKRGVGFTPAIRPESYPKDDMDDMQGDLEQNFDMGGTRVETGIQTGGGRSNQEFNV